MRKVVLCLIAPLVAITVALSLAVAPPGTKLVLAGSGSFNGSPLDAVAFATSNVVSPSTNLALPAMGNTAAYCETAVTDTGPLAQGINTADVSQMLNTNTTTESTTGVIPVAESQLLTTSESPMGAVINTGPFEVTDVHEDAKIETAVIDTGQERSVANTAAAMSEDAYPFMNLAVSAAENATVMSAAIEVMGAVSPRTEEIRLGRVGIFADVTEAGASGANECSLVPYAEQTGTYCVAGAVGTAGRTGIFSVSAALLAG